MLHCLPRMQRPLSVYDNGAEDCLQDKAEMNAWLDSCPPQDSFLVCPSREITHLFVALVAACRDWGRLSKDRMTHFLAKKGVGARLDDDTQSHIETSK